MFEGLFIVESKNFNFKDEDIKLVELCKNGHKESFEILVKKHQKNVINFAYRILENFEDACDIAQDAFFIAYKKIKTFKEEAKFSTWLYKITLNLSRNQLKKKKKEKYLESINNQNLSSKAPIPTDEIEKEELRKKISNCLNLLNEEFKEIIILRDIEGLSYEEIAYLLKIPEGTVKSRLARARESFIEKFEKLRRI